MPYQNRVSPTGAILRDPARGMFTGNRGCLHDEERQIVRPYQSRRWIICLTEFKGRRAELMRPGFYTHLFFLDEATALTAGHRPCAECRRDAYLAFRDAWAAANPELAGSQAPSAETLDAALHGERVTRGAGGVEQVTYHERLGALPDGAIVMLPGDTTPHLVLGASLLPWSFAGYGAPRPREDSLDMTVLTPRSTVAALARGYAPALHPSARSGLAPA